MKFVEPDTQYCDNKQRGHCIADESTSVTDQRHSTSSSGFEDGGTFVTGGRSALVKSTTNLIGFK